MTAIPWPYDFDQYATADTYERAATWLQDCETVADWGGASGHFQRYLPPTVRYTLVDGTLQTSNQVLADLCTYTVPSAGILLRHVLDCTQAWEPILANALAAFQRRMVIVTFMEPRDVTTPVRQKHRYPYWHFSLDELRARLAPWLVRDEAVTTTHPERVFYLERPAA